MQCTMVLLQIRRCFSASLRMLKLWRGLDRGCGAYMLCVSISVNEVMRDCGRRRCVRWR